MSASGRGHDAAHNAPDGALLRFSLPAGAWAENVPPVPGGATATVTFSSEQAEAEHGDALRLLGYTVLGVLAPTPGRTSLTGMEPGETAEMLVSRAVLERHVTWFRSLLSQSAKAFDLSMGPVVGALRARWQPHVRARLAPVDRCR